MVGIGGGIVGMVILLFIFNYTTKQVYQIIFCIMFGGQLGNLIQTYQNDRGSFDLTFTSFSIPMVLLGNALGLVINQWIPGVI